MGPRRNVTDQVSTIDARIEQLRKQKEDLLAREKERSKKERTQRLIRNGALAEQYLQLQDWSPDNFEIALKLLVESDGFKEKLCSINKDRIAEYKITNGVTTDFTNDLQGEDSPEDNNPEDMNPVDEEQNQEHDDYEQYDQTDFKFPSFLSGHRK
ncbi:MAG: hypothetical protein FWF88_12365 [Peptococcaceae bacterium]|nr:hypothetical protein [Peptococcaceae bacterium]